MQVKATYKYAAEDSDELAFEGGEIIHVVQYEDPEEQEEGWLMGIREVSGEKGLFPANFTRPIWWALSSPWPPSTLHFVPRLHSICVIYYIPIS